MSRPALYALVLALCLSAPSHSLQAASETAPQAETLSADTHLTTAEGSTFIAPAGWSIVTRGQAVVLAPPEGDSQVALVDVHATDADAAVKAAWAIVRPGFARQVAVAVDDPPREGWEASRSYEYETSPNEKRRVEATAGRHGEVWTVVLSDVADATGEKRLAQFRLLLGRLLPKGYVRETFAGKAAHRLDAAHVKLLTDFVEASRRKLGVPGVALALIDHDQVVFEGGFGVRELGKPEPVDANTRFMIASNTKALTTLLLAKLVDEGKTTWDAPVTRLDPEFRLGDADTTRQVLLRHLVCACTGLPRQDFELMFEFAHATPRSELELLATIQPTSRFGEMFQYSNSLAAAAGYVAGHVLYPGKELGAAYDEAMRTRVFGPLGMKDVTFDMATALAGDHAGAYGLDVDGRIAPDVFAIDSMAVPLRPAGGLWSSVHDLSRYVRMELGNGRLDGKRYIGEAALLARRAAQVPIGTDAVYGMGLVVDRGRGVEVVHHGGDLVGYHSDMMWLPAQQVGAVIFTNADPGRALVGAFRRRLLEVLFDGKLGAVGDVDSAAEQMRKVIAAERPHLQIPPAPALLARLASRYESPTLGALGVETSAEGTLFDFGEWQSAVASRQNDDGTTSFVTISPGVSGLPFVVGEAGGKRTLTLRDAQHEYVFTERAAE